MDYEVLGVLKKNKILFFLTRKTYLCLFSSKENLNYTNTAINDII